MIGGYGADISSMISEECFEYLDASCCEVKNLDTPVPFSYVKEDFLPKHRFERKLKDLLNY